MKVVVNPNRVEDYRLFLRAKSLPSFRCVGNALEFPDEYAKQVMGKAQRQKADIGGEPWEGLFDYQRDITEMSLRKRKFCCFAECGLGKTLILLEFARRVSATIPRKGTLIVSPLMVVRQTLAEADKFYGGSLKVEQVAARDLQSWLSKGKGIGITNYDGLHEELRPGNLGALVADESSTMKGHYGVWARTLLGLGAGLDWKLALTGTPAPNDRIEYANHAVFMDAFPTVNAFLAKFFINRGQTENRWELKPHALRPFYRALSHWAIFLTNPATYGWKDNVGNIPPIHVHIHDVPLTEQQRTAAFKQTGALFAGDGIGGIGTRAKIGQIAKGNIDGEAVPTHKFEFIRNLIASWPEESTLVWCLFNAEQDRLAKEIPGAASIDGSTPMDERERIIDGFKRGEIKTVISKPKVLGFGLNLQVATRQVFSGLADSYESYYQAVKRSNRVGSKRPLNVHIPITDLERPMVENVLRKAAMVQSDTEEQERVFSLSRTA
jgi:superfamily II DNA or RNA helicase